jgi:putative ABC transport system permease protein
MSDLWRDLRFAVRSLAKNPSFSLIAIVTLSLGIGATTSIFSVVNAVVIQPLPYPQADELVHVGTAMTDGRATGGGLSPFALVRLREQSSNYEDFAGAFRFEVAIQDPAARPLKTEAYVVTEGFFDIFGAPMALGRGFTPEEHLQNTDAGFLVLSHRLWANAYGADPSIVGSTIAAGRGSYTIVGVAGPDFDYPAGADLWVAFAPPEDITAVFLDGVARLADGSSLQQGRTELAMLATRYAEESTSFRARTIVATDLKEWVVGDSSQTLLILLAAAVTLLLIACANVTTLLLSRGAARTREIALRAALGAGRWRLAQQLVTEALTLAAAGAVAALLLTVASLQLLSRVGPGELPRLSEVGIDSTVLAFTLGVTAATGVLFGLMPAVRLVSTDIRSLMGGSSRGASGGRGGSHVFNTLVFAQTGLAVVLVIGAGLLVRSFDRLSRAEGGFTPQGVLVMDVNLAQAVYPSYDEVVRMYEQLADRVREIPGVTSAGFGPSVPFGPTRGISMSQYVVGIDNWDEPPRAQVRPVAPGYLEALDIRLVEGRGISRDDRPEGPGVAVVNETYVAQMLQGAPALGQQVNFSVAALRDAGNPVGYQRLGEWEIVGVVEDAKFESMAIAPTPDVYVPHTQINTRRGLFVVHTEGREPTDVTAELRALVREVDPTVPVEFNTMETLISNSLGTERLAMTLLLAFGMSAAALAAVGIYGVIALSVEGRIPEMAIRAALGAEPGQILWLAMSRGFLLGAVGIVAGAGAAVLGRRVLASQLYEISATDPMVMIGAPLALALVAFVAVLVPGLRTRRINLSTTLRAEN